MFISFEGMDGSGKTTQAQQFIATLRERGYRVTYTREPGGTTIGDQIRTILLDDMHNTDMHPRSELLLFCASRAQLVAQVIQPILGEGGIIICDRYADSTLAYQGYGHGLDVSALQHILDFATGGVYPQVTVYLDIAPERSIERRQQAKFQGEEWNRLDDMALAFHRRVYNGYETLIEREPQRWQRIDADQPIDAVQRDIQVALLPLIEAQSALVRDVADEKDE